MIEPRTSKELVRLMERVAAGDRAAFTDLYNRTSGKIYGIILRIVRRRDLADEIMQELYVKIWERAGDFDPARASAIAWMAAIARNRALDEVRRKSIVEAGAPLEEAGDPVDTARPVLELLEVADDWARLSHCLEALEANRQQIVRLAYLDGCSREELAQRFGAPVATIKTWLHRSLKQLKDCLST
ncbi:MAG: sigma-70 family RNA polymerase sigma factor [Hyphomicrobiaceae bacterium]